MLKMWLDVKLDRASLSCDLRVHLAFVTIKLQN